MNDDLLLNDDIFVKMPIKIFEEQYLPLLYQENPIDFNEPWVEKVAGSVTNFVVLIDDNGNRVDIVPPLKVSLDLSDIISTPVLEEVDSKAMMSEVLGSIAFDNALAKATVLDNNRVEKLAQLWIEFFTRRGYVIPNNSINKVKVLPDSGYDINDDY